MFESHEIKTVKDFIIEVVCLSILVLAGLLLAWTAIEWGFSVVGPMYMVEFAGAVSLLVLWLMDEIVD